MKSYPLHTFSIVGFEPSGPSWGVAVASKFLAAGALVAWARAGAGAVATQALAKVSCGSRGLDLMLQGLSAQAVLSQLLQDDPEREHRQIACVDAQGRAAAFTGAECLAWAGHRVGNGYACQGNILTGPETLTAMADAFEITQDDLATRLIAALLAGDVAGGDRRGKQSAALLVVKPNGGYGGDNDRYIDLRVDDDPDPVRRLAALLNLHTLYFGKTDPDKLVSIDSALAIELQTVLTRLGYYHGPVSGIWDDVSIQAFWSFISTENLEERWSPANAHKIDPVILNFILELF